MLTYRHCPPQQIEHCSCVPCRCDHCRSTLRCARSPSTYSHCRLSTAVQRTSSPSIAIVGDKNNSLRRGTIIETCSPYHVGEMNLRNDFLFCSYIPGTGICLRYTRYHLLGLPFFYLSFLRVRYSQLRSGVTWQALISSPLSTTVRAFIFMAGRFQPFHPSSTCVDHASPTTIYWETCQSIPFTVDN